MSATAWGPIALLGSGEFEPWAEEAERLIISAANGDGSVAILPLASAPEGETYADWAHKVFDQLGRASLTFFSGGNPAHLADSVNRTPLGDRQLDALESGAALAGCSAGACLMGEAAPESATDQIDEHLWVRGLGLLPGVWVVPHWDALGGRVREYFLAHPGTRHREATTSRQAHCRSRSASIGVDRRRTSIGTQERKRRST